MFYLTIVTFDVDSHVKFNSNTVLLNIVHMIPAQLKIV